MMNFLKKTISVIAGTVFSLHLCGQNPIVSIATFKNDADGAYNIIHDDFGDYGVIGINNYVDTMAYNRGIKITFGAITSSCESNPGMYEKAQSMIDDHHHEIINHSHTHSCAVTNESCGGTGPYYGWAVPVTQRFDVEVDQSTQSILTHTGIQPRFFIYPYDQFNTASDDYLQSKGYIGSRTGAYNSAAPDNLAPDANGFFHTPLVVDVANVGGQWIAQNLNYWVDYAISNSQWVNRELHNVGSTGWGHVELTDYRNHLNYVKQKMDNGELWVGSISEILTYQIQKLNYTPSSSWNGTSKIITVNWNTPAFDVASYLEDLHYKSPITLKVDVSNAVHAGNYQISQNSFSINDYKKVGSNLLINVYPHLGPVEIQVTSCATLCINTQPESETVQEGDPVSISVVATGLNPISYQWYKNGFLLDGQNSATLNIPSAQLSDAGNYHVVVSNSNGNLTSAQAQLTVNLNPCLHLCISEQPQDTSANIGEGFSLSVQAQGVQPVSYQWYHGEDLIDGATSSTYTVASAILTDAGSYTVVLTNSTGSVTSQEATVEIYNQQPYGGVPATIPGIVQMENFDTGGQNISYYDSSPTNQGDATTYRNNEVDIETNNDGSAGYHIGYMTNNEWLEYTVDVAATANYDFRFRTAGMDIGTGNGAFRIEMDGSTILTVASVPFTGSWTTFTDVTVDNIPLTEGIHVMRVYVTEGDFNFNYIDVTQNDVPAQPSVISGNNSVCTGTENYSVTNVAGVTYTWSVSGGGTISGSGNSISVNWTSAGNHTLTCTPSNSNGSGIPRTLSVTVNPVPAQPSAISGNNSVCTGSESYSVTNVTGVTYTWSVSGGGTISGSGNSISVNWTSAGNYTLTCTPSNTCGNGTARDLSVTVTDIPLQPGDFTTSSSAVTQGQTGVIYTVPFVAGVTYAWSYSGTGAAINGSGNSVTVDFSASATDGVLSVTANDGSCISTPRQLSVTVSPLTAVQTFLAGSSIDVYPNPFQEYSVVSIDLSAPIEADLEVYNVMGLKVLTLFKNKNLSSGNHRFELTDIPSGTYIVKLKSGTIEKYFKVIKN